jgi:N-acetylglucosamine-6-phosphate deacetylase
MNCVYARKLYTGKSVMRNTYVIFSRQKISGVSTSKKGDLMGEFDVVTPAFIDPHCNAQANPMISQRQMSVLILSWPYRMP